MIYFISQSNKLGTLSDFFFLGDFTTDSEDFFGEIASLIDSDVFICQSFSSSC